MADIEIIGCESVGYRPALHFGAWRIAFLTFAQRFSDITYLERHKNTDEAFVLLKGSAKIYIGEEMECYVMEPNKIYNVKRGVWHNIKVSCDALVLIVENADTSKENSEYMDVTN